MSKEQFIYPETKPVFELIEEASRRSGVSRGRAFEDFLHMSVCSLSGGVMEDQYLSVVERHKSGKPGRRGCDSIAQAFGTLVANMEQTHGEMIDILGDLFQGAITYGEAGQFLTPQPLCRAIAQMTIHDEGSGEDQTEAPASMPPVEAPHADDLRDESSVSERPTDNKPIERTPRRTVCDPACGSGRMLLAVAEINPHWLFVGQDVDLRCVRLTALNLAFRNLHGYVIWGNSLALEKRLVYQTGFNLKGVIREVPLEECPNLVRQAASDVPLLASTNSLDESSTTSDTEEPPRPQGQQLRLF